MYFKCETSQAIQHDRLLLAMSLLNQSFKNYTSFEYSFCPLNLVIHISQNNTLTRHNLKTLINVANIAKCKILFSCTYRRYIHSQ